MTDNAPESVVFIDPYDELMGTSYEAEALALRKAIAETHQEEHTDVAQRWCSHPLCRAAEEWT